MMHRRCGILLLLALTCLCLAGPAQEATRPPFTYVWGTAYHVLPETHTDESGYFSICEGLNGKIYVGTAAYSRNAYLVEFDPRTQRQRIVIDTHKLCGLTATGYAAQAKIHTRNFVGPSGTIYVGSKQGYRRGPDDTADYPGGYLMTYDPKTDKAVNLGMPYQTEGIIDVTADEARGLIYLVTCENQHWMRYDMKTQKFRELGPILLPYAVTLVDAKGRAHAVTKDFRLATYDPKTDRVTVRPILVDGKPWTSACKVPIWVGTKDGTSAYLILMNDPTLLRFNLLDAGKTVKPANLGKMTDGPGPDSRSGLSLGPDGRLYALIRVNNTTGFGTGYLHHLYRYDPAIKRHEDLGVLAVNNPNFFAWKTPEGKPKPWSHGYHTLPDGTLTPLHAHQGLTVAADNTIYATILYPFTLLKIDAFAAKKPTPAEQYVQSALLQCATVQEHLDEISAVAETVAKRHLAGGFIDFPWNGQSLQQELAGRAGGMMTYSRPWWTGERPPEQKAHDVAIIGWERAPGGGEAARLAALRQQGVYVIGFGPKALPALADCVQQCDAFFDTGLPDDRVVTLADGRTVGRMNHLVQTLYAWAFTGELVAACTRAGKMPPMWQSWAVKEGKDWSEKYAQKIPFHEDLPVPPVAKGVLGQRYLDAIRDMIVRFGDTQLPAARKAAELVAAELAAKKLVYVLTSGHMPWVYVGRFEDKAWATPIDFHASVESQVKDVEAKVPEGALAVRLGYFGEADNGRELLAKKKLRLVMISAKNPYPEMALPAGSLVDIDLDMAFGDACVTLEQYPLKILPPSGIMQIVAYEAVNAEVLSRLPSVK